MGMSIGDLILAIVGGVMFILAFILLVNEILGQLYFFTLQPSKAVILDISMRILSSLATSGEVNMKYRNITSAIEYSFSHSDKIFCSSAKSEISNIRSLDCTSLPFKINLAEDAGNEFEIEIKKWFDLTYEKPEVTASWLR